MIGDLHTLVDMHSHILPGIDDGSPDIATSAKMLEAEKRSGVSRIALTPHFSLSSQTVEGFLVKRGRAYEKLAPVADRLGISLSMGAEVLYTRSLADIDLKRLCIENTGYMMIELPYERLTERFVGEFRSLEGSIFPDIRLILAHAERYLAFTSEESLLELISPDLLIQVNCGSFRGIGKHRPFIQKLIRNNMLHLLGTDCHNTTNRAPDMDIAKKAIGRKFSPHVFTELMNNAHKVLNGEQI